ncbi:MAG TPA: hypothetical protein VH599_16155, partial [Ktedonobacterales bacterium]
RPSFPSGRYLHTNPLRREAGLRLLSGPLPAPLRARLLRAWRRPALFSGEQTPLAVQSALRQRPDPTKLYSTPALTLGFFTLTELEVARRVLEAPLASISRMTRNTLLVAQGAYLRLLYAALVAQVGEAAALAEFERLLAGVG